MAALTVKSTKLNLLGVGALFFSAGALTFGAGTAGADQNDPAMTEVGGSGVVNSRQSASVTGGDYCSVTTGTKGASTVSSNVGVPMQRAEEAGPEWVGSRGWQAIGLSPSNPWGGAFSPGNTGTGPQCGKGSASGF
ncbi:MAG: hypothetical protein K0U71_15705 [Actinomycetia bacterium]|nr:hypothetical protein [Actinomycetes bacterium]